MKRDEAEWVVGRDDWGNVGNCGGICRENRPGGRSFHSRKG